MGHVIKVLRASELEAFRASGTFAGSPDDIRDGFIHLSSPAQTPGTLARHFLDESSRGETGLSLLVFDPKRLGDQLKWETSRGGDAFPHYYGTLSWGDVEAYLPVDVGSDGRHVLPEDFT